MRQRGRQFLIAAVAVALWCVCCVAVLPGLAERVGRSLNIGYAVGCDSRHCVVTGVDPRGPAAGMLQRGDAILDIDGVSGFSLDRPTRLVSSATPPGSVSGLRVRRGEQIMSFAIPVRTDPAKSLALEVGTYFLMSLSCLAAALLTSLARPDLPAARWYAVSSWLIAIRNVMLALNWTQTLGWVDPPFLQWLFIVSWWFLPTAYLFLANFPRRAPNTLFRRILDLAAIALTCLFWFLQFVRSLPWLVPTAYRWPMVQAIPLVLTKAANSGVFFEWPVLGGLCVAMAVYSFRGTREPDERRRGIWLVVVIVLAISWQALSRGLYLAGVFRAETMFFFNAATSLVPLVLVYAIAKHRVMGIRLLVRLSLQYLMARSFLLLLLVCSVVALEYAILRNPGLMARHVLAGTGSVLLICCVGVLLPTRENILGSIDRRFFREAWDSERLQETLLNELQVQPSFRRLADVVGLHLSRVLHPSVLDIYDRIERCGDFYSATRARVAAQSELGSWLDSHGAAEIVPALRFPGQIPSSVASPEELVISMPGGEGGAGFILLGEKKSQEPWTRGEKAMLRGLATQMGLRHEVLALEEERLNAVDRERKRMARELHDTLSQGFAGIFLHLESARELIGEDPERTRHHVDLASDLARRSLGAARESVRNLRTFGPALDLERELRELARRLTANSTQAIECSTRSERAVPDEMAAHLLRIAEESVTNSIKHSGATRIAIVLQVGRSSARLTIRDNGAGFDVAGVRSAGYGLTGMRERSEQLGGSLEIVSAPGEGVEIVAVAPMPAAAHAGSGL